MKIVSEEVVKDGKKYTDYYLSYKQEDGKEHRVRVRPVFSCDYWRFKELSKDNMED